jgi:4-hydroxythreonine-4-phosphate dehydrogenase
MNNRLIKIGITHGDMNGTGYEVIIKALADERMVEVCTPVIYGSIKLIEQHRRAMSLPALEYHVVQHAGEAEDGKINLVNCIKNDPRVHFGQTSPAAGAIALKALETAVADMKKGDLDTLVTAPVNKYSIQTDAFHFSGHTEYLQQQWDNRHSVLMILVRDTLRVALATGHLPLSQVAARITKECILEKLRVFRRSLIQDFAIPKPLIAVLSLNPHAGDNGLLGSEEKDFIRPAMDEAKQEGIVTFGPYAADGFFGTELYTRFDGILAMYHDQGLTPFKTLAPKAGVNYTAGLPFIRTSPAHGTAFDIAGRNRASAQSFRQALFASMDLFRNRKTHTAITAAPLQKLYVNSGTDSAVPGLENDSDATLQQSDN